MNLAFLTALVVGAWALTRIGSAERNAAQQFLGNGSVAGGTTLCSGAGCPVALPPVTASGSPFSDAPASGTAGGGSVQILLPPPGTPATLAAGAATPPAPGGTSGSGTGGGGGVPGGGFEGGPIIL